MTTDSGCWSAHGAAWNVIRRYAMLCSGPTTSSTTAEKMLLDRCSVFAGGFDLESACAVAGSDDIDDFAVLDLLDALVRKSLLVADRSSGHTRFSMLETIRQFAEEQLVARGEADQVRAAHARHFAEQEAEIMALWDSPRQRETSTWFTAELANLRTAFRWAADNDHLTEAAAIAVYATALGNLGGQYEPIGWAEEFVEPARAVDHPRLVELYEMASHCWLVGKFEAAVGYGEAGQTVLGNGREYLARSGRRVHTRHSVCLRRPASTGGRVVSRPAERWSRRSYIDPGSSGHRTVIRRIC